jgi:NADH:ubiquinone oxidoreductase subunit 4 (subunit M)
MYGRRPKEETRIVESKRLLVPIFVLVGAIIVLGLFPQIIFNLIQPSVNQIDLIKTVLLALH